MSGYQCDVSCGCECLPMRQTESLHVAIHAPKGTKSDGGSWESMNMTSEFTQTTMPKKSKISTGNTEQLIELVREHPHVYNPRLPKHRDVQLIHNTWVPYSRSTCCGEIMW